MAGRLPERPVKRRPEEQSFSQDGEGVKVTLREGEAGNLPVVELSNTNRGPDDKKESQFFSIAYEKFLEIGERLRSLMVERLRAKEPKDGAEEPRRKEAKREAKEEPRSEPPREYWPVVRIERTLQRQGPLSAWCSRFRAETTRSYLPPSEAPWPSSRSRSRRNTRKVTGSLLARARRRRSSRSLSRTLARWSGTTSSRSGPRPPRKQSGSTDRRSARKPESTHSAGRSGPSHSRRPSRVVLERIDNKGRKHRTVLHTRPVRQEDGSVREVVTLHTEKEIQARARKHDAGGKEQKAQRTEEPKPEQTEVKPKRVGYETFLGRVFQEEGRYNQLGIWMGVEKQVKGQPVRLGERD